MTTRHHILTAGICLFSLNLYAAYDLVIYGGSSAGIAAAVQAKRMEKSVVVIEPSNRIGGLTTGGLGRTDIGNQSAIGGISREFYQAIQAYYDNPSAWKWQEMGTFKNHRRVEGGKQSDVMWHFEPSVALAVYQDWVHRDNIEVVYGERLNRTRGVKLASDKRIESITMESGRAFEGKMFLDTTYEGDLMAAAKVSYTLGREANSLYGETYNGMQVKNSTGHQIAKGVDPYVIAGDPSSGLLPFIELGRPEPDGTGDKRIQAYNFRMCLTNHEGNRIPFAKPTGYNEQWYELLFRDLEAQAKPRVPWINSLMPNCKTDTNNSEGVSTDFIGQNYGYPEASYAEREAITARHLLYQQGLMWTLAYHPRVPQEVRDKVSKWGVCKDEFIDTGHWPGQIYVREARRLVGDYVMKQADCQGAAKAEDSIGLAAYTMDSHHVQRFVTADGFARNEGNIQKKGFPPYPISYRSIIPKETECPNLLVPICLSASHIAYGSIRMEPVFMVMGQSAATAAALAIDAKVPVQKVDYAALSKHLLKDKQVLEWVYNK